MKNIIVFGFSVTGDKPGFLECWEDDFGSQHRDWNVSRVAIGGLQPHAGRHLVPSIIEERKPDYIIFEIATAISRISRLTREKLTGHIDTINFLITLCQERSIKCGFLDLPQEGIDPDRDWMLDIHKDILARCGIPHLVRELEPNTLRDNVHPNSFGRKLYAAALERILCEVEASSTASYHLAKSGKRFEALPATQAVVGNYDYEVFERRGFKANVVKIQARQNQLFRVFEGAVTVGFIVVMGPKTGYMNIDLDGVSRRISAFDRYCYYTRLGGRNVVRSNCRLIHITQLADQPKEPLLKGEKVIAERQGGVAFILIEIEEALSREYILADKKIKDFFLGK